MRENIGINKKNDRLLEITVRDSTGAPINLGGATLEFLVWDNNKLLFVVLGVVSDPPAGRVDVELTSAQVDIPAGDYRYELLLTDILGNRYTTSQGTLEIKYSLGGG